MTYAPDPSLDLLARYLRDDVAADERRRVLDWLAGDPTRATELEDLRRILAASTTEPDWDLDRIWGSIEGRLPPPPAQARRERDFSLAPRRRWSGVARAAAAALVVASGTTTVLLLQERAEPAPEPAPRVLTTSRGQRLSVRLPDSTLVIMGPESRLEIAAAYGDGERRVRFEGEAAFTVEHDETRPFAVETRGAVARDLGTRFLVRAYPADSATEVVVAEGLVAIGRMGDSDSLVVTPGELARVTDDGRLGVTRGVALDGYFAWTDGRLVFADTPLREVVARLERWYDVEVRLPEPSLGARRVTATFQRESPEEILRLVSALLGLEVGRNGRVYTLRPRS